MSEQDPSTTAEPILSAFLVAAQSFPETMPTALAALALGVWVVLTVARGGYWRSGELEDRSDLPPPPALWPDVVAVVPARDEADTITRSLGALVGQDYPGRLSVVLVDDQSSDGTADRARAITVPAGRSLRILSGSAVPPGWTGKLWAVSQGIEVATNDGPEYLWLVDADIVVAPDLLRRLVSRAEASGLVLASLMARLRCHSAAEKLFIPAFIFFFRMIYPFAWVNDRTRKTAAAAGGVCLVRRTALERAGGIAAIRDALIDDCALGRRMKSVGPISLMLTNRAHSLRGYDRVSSIRSMVVRSAYAQLRYSPWLLILTILGMVLVYLVPPGLGLFGQGTATFLALVATGLMMVSFVPIQRFYGLSPWRALTLPLIAVVYGWWTIDSAWQHWRGRGGSWKGRAQAVHAARAVNDDGADLVHGVAEDARGARR